MANKRDIKRRLVSVTNTQKITKAMKLVAAAKFARASHAVSASRHYSRAFQALVGRFVGSLVGENMDHPFLRQNEQRKILLIVVGTDRGLCGGLNSNLGKAAVAWMKEKRNATNAQIDIYAWGRKGLAWANKQKCTIVGSKEKVLDKPKYEGAQALAADVVARFADYDAVYIAYNEFQSALAQSPQVDQLLPVALPEAAAASEKEESSLGAIIVEPSKNEVLGTILQRQLNSKMLQVMLEGAASEHGSRMTAMDSATTNAGEVRKKLTLKYNRVRQAAITKELIEIISGAEAL